MHIMDKDGKQIINIAFVERFCIVQKNDAALIVASYNDTRSPVTIGRYKDIDESKDALSELFSAIAENSIYFEMPDGLRRYEMRTVKDARVKRKGGS